jgi:acetyl esterase/lipase
MPPFAPLRPQPPLNPLADQYGEACLRRSEAVARTTRCVLDIPYGAETDQRLDIYLPEEAGADLPVMIFWHGGGFTHGYKEWCGLMAPPLTAHPAILVSPAYRLMDEVVYPAAMEDCVLALAWVHQHIAEFGGSKDRIFIGGHSAGALLSSVTALDHARLAAHGLGPEVVKAVFPISGTFNRRGMTGQIGYEVPPGPIELEARSPLSMAHAARAPFFITWGGKERQLERVERTSMMFIGAIRDAGRPAGWLMSPEADHFTVHLATGEPQNPWTETVRRWFDALPTHLMGEALRERS